MTAHEPLKPCPVCRKPAISRAFHEAEGYRGVSCSDSDCLLGGSWYPIPKWNTRPSSVEALSAEEIFTKARAWVDDLRKALVEHSCDGKGDKSFNWAELILRYGANGHLLWDAARPAPLSAEEREALACADESCGHEEKDSCWRAPKVLAAAVLRLSGQSREGV